MKRFSAILMSLVLASGSTLALADRGGQGNDHRGWNKGHGYKDSHHGGKHWSGKYSGSHHGYYRPEVRHHYVHHYPRYYRGTRVYYSNYDPYLPLGAALVGGAIGYSLGHSQHNSVTTTTTYTQAPSTVSGCYRIERYQDGSERRVELPPYECN